ncbi:hypothetical protein [Streptomyces ehimensis]|uniref:Uncharacterized protein n=1 Tax=Streptomyces ehimensis TaxID=68195 RepID=A0ABV9BU49_9ACTN
MAIRDRMPGNDHLAKQHPDCADIAAVRLGIKWAWESGHITYRNTAASLHWEERQFALLGHVHPGLTLTGPDPRAATVALLRRRRTASTPPAPAAESASDAPSWTTNKRRVILARRAEGQSIREIAAAVRVSVGVVHKILNPGP